MRPIAFVFLFVVTFASVRAGLANSEYRAQSGFTALATEVPMASSEDRVPLGFSMLVIDIPCKDVINYGHNLVHSLNSGSCWLITVT